ncbi:MAG TPA: glycosyltransferase family 4 protein [Terriglobales bacterium]|nr:glycosyltransferase family 4 protein [Terriglobales bacterium]
MKPRLLFIVESGTDVRLIEGLADNFELTVLARKIEGGVEISRQPSTRIWMTVGPAGRLAFARFVFAELVHRRSEIDIVLVQGYSLAALAANIVRQFTSVPVIMLVCSPVEAYYHCRLLHPYGRPYQKREATIVALLARLNALLGERYLVLSEYLSGVVRRYGARTVHTIPIYGVDTRIFEPPLVSKEELKSQLRLPRTGTLIFFSSRVAPEKDSETLLRAVRTLVDEGHDLWLLHRSGGYRQFLADAEKFGVHTRVIATDAVHPHRELPLDYQVCDICVQASREEGLGFSPLEALACETPVIATSVGGLRETVVDGHTGWTYPVGDHHALAARVREVIAKPEEAKRRAREGRTLVVQKFDRRRVFDDFSDLVRRILLTSGKSFTEELPCAASPPIAPLRIVLAIHVRRDEHTAVYRNTCQRAMYFESRGHRCTILTTDDFPWIQKLGHRFTPILFPIALANWFRTRDDEIDVAMFHSYAGWLITFLRRHFNKFKSLKTSIMFHGLEPLYFEQLAREVPLSFRYRLLQGKIVPALLKCSCLEADLLMCLNSQEAQFLVDHRWATRDKTKIVSNPAPDSFFHIHRTYAARATRLLFVGQWLPMKGIRYLLDAFISLHQRYPDLQLCCAGTLASEEEVLKEFPEIVRGSVSVRPRVNPRELLELHEQADIFVLPSLSEGSSVALIEAMSSALPIVTTPVGAAPDLLLDKRDAIFVPVRDARSLSTAIEFLIDKQQNRERLGRAARKAAECLQPSVVWKGHANCLDAIVSGHAHPSAPKYSVATGGAE